MRCFVPKKRGKFLSTTSCLGIKNRVLIVSIYRGIMSMSGRENSVYIYFQQVKTKPFTYVNCRFVAVLAHLQGIISWQSLKMKHSIAI